MTERKAPARKAAAKPKTAKPDAPEPTADVSDIDPQYDDVGYVGQPPDVTPNENYSLQGVIQGLPVPEHDR